MRSLELEDYARQFESVNAEARALVASHGEAVLTRPMEVGGWSAAECLEHVATTAAAYLPVLRAAVEAGRREGWLSDGPFAYGPMARLFVWAIEPPVRMRVRAPKLFAPREQPDVAAALEAFVARHSETIDLMQAADGVDLQRIRIESPANAVIKLPLGAAFLMLAAHARRHLWQIRRGLSASGTSS
jgi:hypothetical protein